jgi:site-specific recombinase XerD
MLWGITMSNLSPSLVGPWVRRFLLEHLVGECNLARNTRLSYRDALSLLLPFAAKTLHRDVDQLAVTDVSADVVRKFLAHLESARHCSVATRNQRLAAIHALASFLAEHSPEHIAWATQIRSVPFKRTARAMIGYLDRPEMDALLAAPDRCTPQGERDYALLLFLYNSGARASEAAQLRISDLNLPASSVKISGKGGKQRLCPLWPLTVKTLAAMVGLRAPDQPVFVNRRGEPITRFGIHTLVERCAIKAKTTKPSMEKKRVSPHTIRHSTASHLLKGGVDINTIRGWLGHVLLDTTNVYAEIDLEAKADALAKCEVRTNSRKSKRWHQPKVMEFLRSL